jgi:hypothetical protein
MEEARRILVQFGRPVPGRDEPTDGALDEGEIQAFQEQMAELLDDIEQ